MVHLALLPDITLRHIRVFTRRCPGGTQRLFRLSGLGCAPLNNFWGTQANCRQAAIQIVAHQAAIVSGKNTRTIPSPLR